ncbi:MAG: hypothetical protein ACLR8P_15120 [Clostridium fessum]
MLAVLGVACVILFFIVINLLLKRKRVERGSTGSRRQTESQASSVIAGCTTGGRRTR